MWKRLWIVNKHPFSIDSALISTRYQFLQEILSKYNYYFEMCDYFKTLSRLPCKCISLSVFIWRWLWWAFCSHQQTNLCKQAFSTCANFIQDYSLYILLLLVSPFTGCWGKWVLANKKTYKHSMSTSSTVLLLNDRSMIGVPLRLMSVTYQMYIISTLCTHVFALNHHTIAAQHFLIIQQRDLFCVWTSSAVTNGTVKKRKRKQGPQSAETIAKLRHSTELLSQVRFGVSGWVGLCVRWLISQSRTV